MKLASRIHSLYVQATLNEYKNELKKFTDTYNNSIHQRLIQKYLCNIENIYKYSSNIRMLLFKHSANINFYDRVRLMFDNNSYILEIQEIYDKLGNIDEYVGFTSFKKKEWTNILNDLIQIYPKYDLI